MDKPQWVNWIEVDNQPHLVVGVECRECHAEHTSTWAAAPEDHEGLWGEVEHDQECPVFEEVE